jgi:hypothetical protein
VPFPKTYDGSVADTENRKYVEDMWTWLKGQPQDAWLLFARLANWDNAEPIFEAMLNDPKCDRSVAAFIFWTADPGNSVSNSRNFGDGDLVHTAISRASRGAFKNGELYLDRYDVAHLVHGYIAAVRQRGGNLLFQIPDVFFGPFHGREASLPKLYDSETEAELKDVFNNIDGWLPRSEMEFRNAERAGGNLWLDEVLDLPEHSEAEQKRVASLSEIQRLESIYGTQSAYNNALKKVLPDRSNRKQGPVFWLLAFAVVSIGGAFIGHYLRTGRW